MPAGTALPGQKMKDGDIYSAATQILLCRRNAFLFKASMGNQPINKHDPLFQ